MEHINIRCRKCCLKTQSENTRATTNRSCCHAICWYLKWVGQNYSDHNLVTKLWNGITVIPILFILQRVLSANQIRVNMEAFASMMECTDAVARIIILEKPALVSVIAVTYNYKVNCHNLLYSGSVTLYSVISLLSLYISMCPFPCFHLYIL